MIKDKFKSQFRKSYEFNFLIALYKIYNSPEFKEYVRKFFSELSLPDLFNKLEPQNDENKEIINKLNNDPYFIEEIVNCDYFKLIFNDYFYLSDMIEEVDILEKNLPQDSNLESVKIFSEWMDKEENNEFNLENKNNEKEVLNHNE